MKHLLIFFLIFYAANSTAQTLYLKEVDSTAIARFVAKEGHFDDVIYAYFKLNYQQQSGKKDVQQLTYPDFDTCAFVQEFEKDITYKIYSCKEAGGTSVTLEFPRTVDKKRLKNWVEEIYSVINVGIPHQWNKDKSQYHPVDEGVGCYYDIIETSDQILVKVYCGC